MINRHAVIKTSFYRIIYFLLQVFQVLKTMCHFIECWGVTDFLCNLKKIDKKCNIYKKKPKKYVISQLLLANLKENTSTECRMLLDSAITTSTRILTASQNNNNKTKK